MPVITRTFMWIEIIWSTIIVFNNLSTVLIVLFHKSLQSSINNLLMCLFVGNLLYGVSTAISILLSNLPSFLEYCNYCCISHVVLVLAPGLVILYSLIAITLDRYIAVFYALRYSQIVKPRYIKRVVILIWCISVTTGCLPLLWNTYSGVESQSFCRLLKIVPSAYIWLFVIPPAIITNGAILFVYIRICCLRHRQLRRITTLEMNEEHIHHFNSDSRTGAMIGIIVFSSVFALTPFLIVVMLAATGLVISNSHDLSSSMCSITYEISFINPMFTPVIFAWRNEHFRKVLKSVIKKRSKVENGRERTEQVIITLDSTTVTKASNSS